MSAMDELRQILDENWALLRELGAEIDSHVGWTLSDILGDIRRMLDELTSA